MNNFGERLKNLRKAAGITQQELADKLNVHLQTVSKWERGLSEPDFSMLGIIASAISVSLEELLGEAPSAGAYSGSFSAASFGRALSSERRKKGENQDEVASAADVSVDTISKWERGVTCPDMRQLCALSQHFGESPSKLYYGINDEPRREVAVGRRKKVPLSLILVIAEALIIILLAVFLSRMFISEFTITVDGAGYTVASGDWFVPENSEKDGYEVKYYVDGDGNTVTFPVKVTADAEYYAVYSPIEYNIDYWLNGGSFTGDVTYTFTVESGSVELAAPVKSGADFEGWYLSADYSGEPVTAITCAAADVTLYAKWSNVVYTVRYELNGGSLSASNPTTVTADEEIVLNEPLRGGYIFLGWYDEPYGGTKYESVGGANASNLTLYALWQQSGAYFSIIYHTQGGTLLGENPVSVGAGEAYALYGAQKTGYDFVGWNTQSDGSGEYYTELYGISDNLELYAIYTAKIYTIIYELNGGTYYDGVNPNSITYGEKVVLAPLSKAGYTFIGWFNEYGDQITVIDESNILRLTTLYARFSGNLYTIFLDGGGGVFQIDGENYGEYTLTVEYGTEYVLPECTLAGYDFLGWLDGKGNIIESVNIVNIGNMTLTASYREAGLTYNITYVLNGGTLSRANPGEVAYNQVVALNDPERNGYLFLGWNTRADGSGEYVTATSSAWESDITLYAIWQEIRVSGSSANFTYEVGQSSVVITGYTGSFGEDVSLVIPSYIEGKPVVAITGALNPDYNNVTGHVYLYSITLPDTLVSLGEYALSYLYITQPVTIPASVSEIGAYCFNVSDISLYFEEGSALKSIGEYAFANAWINNTVVLPEGIETLEAYAFDNARLAYGGMVLPNTLKYIGYQALGLGVIGSDYRYMIYIPSSVEYIEPYAFVSSSGGDIIYLYTALSPSVTSGFGQNWNSGKQVIYLESEVSGITLRIDGEEVFVPGQQFALPELEKAGCTFIGWRDTAGDFVYCNYIPLHEGIVLEAVFEEQSQTDGRSQSSPAILELGETYEFIVFGGEEFYFIPDVAVGERIVLTFTCEAVNYNFSLLYVYYYDADHDQDNAITSDAGFAYAGEILTAGYGSHSNNRSDGVIYRLTVTVTVRNY